MSRNVDLSKPLSEFDRKYLEDRSEWRKIAQADGTTVGQLFANIERYGTSAGPTAVEEIDEGREAGKPSQPEEGSEEWVESLTVAQLQEEISKRDPKAPTAGKKAELQDTLLDILADEEEDQG